MIVVGVSIVEDSTKLEFKVVASTDESARIEMIESNLIIFTNFQTHQIAFAKNNNKEKYQVKTFVKTCSFRNFCSI